MNILNDFLVLGLILACACILRITGAPNPDADKWQHRSLSIYDDGEENLNGELRQADDIPLGNENESKTSSARSGSETDSSSGRLFLKKFLLFRNLFNTNTQPVIPIIITGAGATFPTSTTIPTTTGTATTGNGNTGTTAATGRIKSSEESEVPDAPQEAENVDMQALQAAIAAGAQEYVVTDQEIKGTLNSKEMRPSSVSLRHKGANRGKVIQVRIPPQYRRYFKGGQKVMLNTGNRQNNRRIVRKGVNNNHRRVNNNQQRNPLISIG